MSTTRPDSNTSLKSLAVAKHDEVICAISGRGEYRLRSQYAHLGVEQIEWQQKRPGRLTGANIVAASTVHLSACLGVCPAHPLFCPPEGPARAPCTFCLFVPWTMSNTATPFACTDHISVSHTPNCIITVCRVDLQHAPTISNCLHNPHRTYRVEMAPAVVHRSMKMICSVDYLREPP